MSILPRIASASVNAGLTTPVFDQYILATSPLSLLAQIIGARNTDQLKDSLASVNVAMTPELRAKISDLSRTPAPATDRSEELKAAR